MLAFGNLAVASGKVTVQGWLYDVKNTASPLVLGKQYTDVRHRRRHPHHRP
jgi:TolB protein